MFVGEDRRLPTLSLKLPQKQFDSRQQRDAVQHRFAPVRSVNCQRLFHSFNRHEFAHRFGQSSADRAAHFFISRCGKTQFR